MLVRILIYLGPEVIFCAFAQFFAGIGPAHFPAETTRPLGRGCLPFSPSFLRCKVTKSKFGTVRICPHLSGNVRFCPHFFFAAKLRKRKLALSSYVHLCPFMSSYDIASSRNLRCKVTKSKIGTVQICPNLSKFVHLIL